MDTADVIRELEALARPGAAEGMARFGIRPRSRVVGVTVTDMRRLAKGIEPDHGLAAKLWDSGIHEARIMATLVDVPALVTSRQMDDWAASFDSWDIVDNATGNLFRFTPFADAKIREWAARDEEFVRRAAFALVAASCRLKGEPDERFLAYLPLIRDCALDRRNFVRKAVNWALREIGKRNVPLNAAAIAAAEEIHTLGGPARWVASDALRELRSEQVQARLALRDQVRARTPG